MQTLSVCIEFMQTLSGCTKPKQTLSGCTKPKQTLSECTELTQTLSGSQIPCIPKEGMHNSCSNPRPCIRYKGALNSCAPSRNIQDSSRLYHGAQNPCRLYQGVYTLWRVHIIHADYQGAQTCVHFMKGTQSTCRLSGCTNLCILYDGCTEFMKTIRVHRPVYTLWQVHRVQADYQGAQTGVHL